MKEFLDMMVITSYFIDNKVEKVTEGKSLFYKIVRLINKIYRPIAIWRFKKGETRFLIEYKVYRLVNNFLSRVKKQAS